MCLCSHYCLKKGENASFPLSENSSSAATVSSRPEWDFQVFEDPQDVIQSSALTLEQLNLRKRGKEEEEDDDNDDDVDDGDGNSTGFSFFFFDM